MSPPNPNFKKCEIYSDSLERTSNKYSLLYTISILLSISLSVTLLTKLIKDDTTITIFGLLAVIFAITPLIFKERIEKVHGYNSLAKEFESLGLNFTNQKNTNRDLLKLRDLTRKLSDYPISRWTKWRVTKKFEKRNRK